MQKSEWLVDQAAQREKVWLLCYHCYVCCEAKCKSFSDKYP